MKLKDKKGFTLVELLVVIAIIGILAVVAVPSLIDNINKAKLVDMKSDVRSIQYALDSYYIDNGKFSMDKESWKNHITESIDTGLEITEEGGYTYYTFESSYKYRFDFHDTGKSLYFGGFELSQSMVNVLTDKSFTIEKDKNPSQPSSEIIIKTNDFKDDFFKNYRAFVYKNGTIWFYADMD